MHRRRPACSPGRQRPATVACSWSLPHSTYQQVFYVVRGSSRAAQGGASTLEQRAPTAPAPGGREPARLAAAGVGDGGSVRAPASRDAGGRAWALAGAARLCRSHVSLAPWARRGARALNGSPPAGGLIEARGIVVVVPSRVAARAGGGGGSYPRT